MKMYYLKKWKALMISSSKNTDKTYLLRLIYYIRTPAEVNYDYALVGLNP